ncbi:hypothetical protein Tsubulata_019856 [Turnera subulata]|uniref:Leucine-rich repeat-containing N-terminal plant-type domain-containing protein n=1 Tax=Turnera subulata TaxID=218843 RepID=A0A9Q0JR16_9ROSI|nr:hypothetical protein Tsubulata_019856 [Turnera subulata]
MAFTMVCLKWSLLLGLLVAFTSSFSLALTDLRDVTAINSLYASLGFPALTRWVPFGGDPCGEEWQGISCVFSNVTAIKPNQLNLAATISQNSADLQSITSLSGNISCFWCGNVEDNLFSSPIPEKLFSIPTFRKEGNPFNTTPILSPSPPPAIPPSLSTPPFAESSQKQANWPFSSNNSPSGKSSNFFTTRKVIGIAVLGAAIIVFLGICCICYKRRKSEEDVEAAVAGAYKGHTVQPDNKSSIEQNNQEQKVLRESTFKSSDRHGLDNGELATRPNPRRDYGEDPKRMAAY